MLTKIRWKKIDLPKLSFSGYDYWKFEAKEFSAVLCPMINEDESAKKGDYKLTILFNNTTRKFVSEINLKKSAATKRAIDIINRFIP